MSGRSADESVRLMNSEIEAVLREIEKVISGKREVVIKLLTAMLAGGHILLDDVPGVGKTTLALALGRAMELDCRRVQFTPDVLPSDIVGFSVYHAESAELQYRPGVVTEANLLLGDEINRTSSKTQSALLEAMEEHQVTVDGRTHPLKDPFWVIATQNHVGAAGTQMLPYAQMDRFMVCLSLGYPDHAAQVEMLRRRQNARPLENVQKVLSLQRVRQMLTEVREVMAKDSVLDYISRLTIATREQGALEIGVSPRGALHIDCMAKAHAYMNGRDFVLPEDVQAVFLDVCAHRVLLTSQARAAGQTAETVLADVTKAVRVPDRRS